MKLILDNQSFGYKGFGTYGPESTCGLKVWSDGTDRYAVLFTNGTGTSVTNASEYIATIVSRLIGNRTKNTRWFETYPENPDQVDEIQYDSVEEKPFVLENPVWNGISKSEFEKIISS